MTTENLHIQSDDFVRRFSMRGGSLMWFLGAGASASAGIPTAGDMIWEFKKQLYVSQRKVSPRSVADLSNHHIRAQIQSHIDSLGDLPSTDSPTEYAALFERAYPSERDRNTYIEAKIAGASPSYGHIALAALMRCNMTRIVWTTNFDPLVADACAKVFGGTGTLTTASLDAPRLAVDRIQSEKWPLEVKLHGDFRSRRLKNTDDELREQDQQLRQVLVDTCLRYGLVVTGYSGRDESIMGAFEEAAERGGFPEGLFWLHRGESKPLPRVMDLVTRLRASNSEAGIVSAVSFDESMRDIVRILPDLDTTSLDVFGAERRRWTSASVPSGKKGWPVIRLNAICINQIPTTCRRVVCDIGGSDEVRKAVINAGVDILSARTASGILAYGTDADIRSALSAYNITEFDIYQIATKKLWNDTNERGLLREALTRAFVREYELNSITRRSKSLVYPKNPASKQWSLLKSIVGNLVGRLGKSSEIQWHEGLELRFDWANDRLWLLVSPRTIFQGVTDLNRAIATDFARERTVKRYNRELNKLMEFWTETLSGNQKVLRALGISDGVDATFRLSNTNAFSRRAGA